MKIIKFVVLLSQFISCLVHAQNNAKLCEVGEGWAGNTVNTAVFRKNSLVTHKNVQYISYYNSKGYLTIGKRKLNSCKWEISQSQYKGNVKDAHNIISIMVDEAGYLHVAWDHHSGKLRYTKTKKPGSLELLEEMKMIGTDENRVTYPEFYKIPGGDILFLYRNGASGSGDLVINKYDTKTKIWSRLQSNLISGEGKRNAYWQAYVDNLGTIHLSWVWRESPDVASNHDMAYACSKDGGQTWESSKGVKYNLPITLETAEYAAKIPQKSELINQTSMSADENGNPFIASYWREERGVPQYKILYNIGSEWKVMSLNFRTTTFSLSGGGTKKIPISRPQVMVKGKGENASVLMLFRDEERANKPSVLKINSLKNQEYKISDLNEKSLGSWEPTYDTELWRKKQQLNVFIQNTEQKDGEGVNYGNPQNVGVLIWKPY